MKKIIMTLIATLLMGGMVMAQSEQRGKKVVEPKERAERMTERMAKEYSLNDKQKAQLLEANLILVEKVGNRPMQPRHQRMKQDAGNKECACCCACSQKARHKSEASRGNKKNLTDAERTQRKVEMQKRHEEMKEVSDAYDAQLKKILTKQQYEEYTKKKNEKRPQQGQLRRE